LNKEQKLTSSLASEVKKFQSLGCCLLLIKGSHYFTSLSIHPAEERHINLQKTGPLLHNKNRNSI
jgi:hypothetical protein